MKYEDINIFLEVVNLGGVRGASKKLDMTPSKISRRIIALEDELGIILLNRNTRHMSLTSAGRQYLAKIQEIQTHIDDLKSNINNTSKEVSGTITITAPQHSYEYMSNIVSEFMGLHSKVIINVHYSDEKVDLISSGFDMALRMGELTDSALIVRKIGETRLVRFASPSYIKKYGTPKSKNDFKKHISISRTPYFTMSDNNHIVGKKNIIINSAMGAIAMVKKGMGIGLLPNILINKQASAGELEIINSCDKFKPTPISLLFTPRMHKNFTVKTFADFLHNKLKQEYI
ncbi:MAG: LysR family transcriptional regulator [Alphaproteobacteria bacterium]